MFLNVPESTRSSTYRLGAYMYFCFIEVIRGTILWCVIESSVYEKATDGPTTLPRVSYRSISDYIAQVGGQWRLQTGATIFLFLDDYFQYIAVLEVHVTGSGRQNGELYVLSLLLIDDR